eukprot:6882426-Prorocentrum_lima.AAC.1
MSRKKSVPTLSLNHAKLAGMVAGIHHGISLLLSLGDIAQQAPLARVLNDNSASLEMVRSGPDSHSVPRSSQ